MNWPSSVWEPLLWQYSSWLYEPSQEQADLLMKSQRTKHYVNVLPLYVFVVLELWCKCNNYVNKIWKQNKHTTTTLSTFRLSLSDPIMPHISIVMLPCEHYGRYILHFCTRYSQYWQEASYVRVMKERPLRCNKKAMYSFILMYFSSIGKQAFFWLWKSHSNLFLEPTSTKQWG